MKIKTIINKITQDSFCLVAALSLFALLTAYSSELLLGLHPCILCIYQRIPYGLMLLFSIITILRPTCYKISKPLIIILAIIEIAFAFYHVGIERHIFEENQICQDKQQIGNLLSTTKLMSSCSDIAFKFMNFSMAEWNVIYAIGLLYYFIKRDKSHDATR